MKKEKVFDCQKLSFYHIKCYSMKYTYNVIGGFRFAENVNKRGEGIMKSQFVSELTMRIWIDFKSHFRSQTTEASYQSDLDEIMEVCDTLTVLRDGKIILWHMPRQDIPK